MQRIIVGLTKSAPGWQLLLNQEGVPFEIVADWSRVDPGSYSALVVSGPLSHADARAVEQYLAAGGAVLSSIAHFLPTGLVKARPAFIKRVLPDTSLVFSHARPLDIFARGYVGRAADTGFLENGRRALVRGTHRAGHFILVPFDVNDAILDRRTARKDFILGRRLPRPSEKVALVSKGEVRRVIANVLILLHQLRHLPLVHAWYHPNGCRTSFGLRIDVDRAPARDIQELFALARKYCLRLDWFVNLKDVTDTVPRFAAMSRQGQNIGLHGFEHRVYDTMAANLANIRQGMTLLHQAKIPICGFVAPHGVWNEPLAASLDALGITYSSEFTLDYDDLPFVPVGSASTYQHLQIPIHPICIGRLARAGGDDAAMGDYFRAALQHCLASGQPAFFYHHPGHAHKTVITKLIEAMINNPAVSITNLRDYAQWWRKRSKVQFSVVLDGTTLKITTSEALRSFRLRIVRAGHEALVPIRPQIRLERIRWRPRPVETGPVGITRRIDLVRKWREEISDWMVKRIRT